MILITVISVSEAVDRALHSTSDQMRCQIVENKPAVDKSKRQIKIIADTNRETSQSVLMYASNWLASLVQYNFIHTYLWLGLRTHKLSCVRLIG